jgi:hypothetical protein
MGGDPSTVSARVGHDQPHAHGPGCPTAIDRDSGGRPSLPIERPEELVNVDDGGLEFYLHKRARGLVPGQKIDEASLDVDRE